MKLATMLKDVLRSLWRPPVTERYPFEKRPLPETARGRLHWDPEQCTGCGLCVKDCPADALEVITIDKKNKRFVMRYHTGRCTFCSQCVQSCRFNCLRLSDEEWELAALNREPFTVLYGRNEDIDELLAGRVTTDAEPVAA